MGKRENIYSDLSKRIVGDTTINTDIESMNTYDKSIITDEWFKKISSYKGIVAMILKDTIREYEELSLNEIISNIEDIRTRHYNSYAEMVEDTVDCLPTEIGNGSDKLIRYDMVFRVKLPGGLNSKVNLTVDLEMQGETDSNKLDYDLVTRGIYYGAALLRDSLPKNERYDKIHKVYSIWICNGIIEFEGKFNEVDDKAIHRYGFRRFYPGIPKVVPTESNADLIEVVFAEIPKFKNASDDSNIKRLFYNIGDTVKYLETNCKVNLTKIRKGVDEVINWEKETQKVAEMKQAEGMTKGIAKGRAEAILEKIKETIKNCTNANYTKEQTQSLLIMTGLYTDEAKDLLELAYK